MNNNFPNQACSHSQKLPWVLVRLVGLSCLSCGVQSPTICVCWWHSEGLGLLVQLTYSTSLSRLLCAETAQTQRSSPSHTPHIHSRSVLTRTCLFTGTESVPGSLSSPHPSSREALPLPWTEGTGSWDLHVCLPSKPILKRHL